MDNDLFTGLFHISALIVGVAVLAVLVSKNSNTVGVMNGYGNMFSTMLGSAEAPVTQSGGY